LVTRQKGWVVDADWLRPSVDTSQDIDRQKVDLLSAGVRRDDLNVDQGLSGARASRASFDRALAALHDGDTLVVTTLDWLG